LGKRTLVRRRGRGGKQFRAIITGKIAPTKYPNFEISELHNGIVMDLVHERGRDAPVAKIKFDDNNYYYVPATEGTAVGSKIEIGNGAKPVPKNILDLGTIPDGTVVCNIERHYGDGGKMIKAAGSSAIVFSHSIDSVKIKFPSGMILDMNPRCRAMIGIIAGGGKGEKPFLKAGNKAKFMQSRGRLYPVVRGIAQAAVYHPHGGGRHQHIGHPSSVGRNTPPGAKVGNIHLERQEEQE
jgi:large subunit ribosomal protein L2